MGQGTSLLTYRMGGEHQADGSVELTEFRIRVPGLRFDLGPSVRVETLIGYHHADFGPGLKFWGDQPMDSWMLDGSVTNTINARWAITAGSAVRKARIQASKTSGPTIFHQTALLARRTLKSGSVFSVGAAYRNGVALAAIPLLGFEGVITPGYVASIMLPGRAHIWKEWSNEQRTGVFGRYETTPFPGPVLGDDRIEVLRNRLIRVGFSHETRASDKWVIRMDVASTLTHDREAVWENGSERVSMDRFVVLDMALIYRPRAR